MKWRCTCWRWDRQRYLTRSLSPFCTFLSNPSWFVHTCVSHQSKRSSVVCQVEDVVSSANSFQSVNRWWYVLWAFILNGDQNDFTAVWIEIISQFPKATKSKYIIKPLWQKQSEFVNSIVYNFRGFFILSCLLFKRTLPPKCIQHILSIEICGSSLSC